MAKFTPMRKKKAGETPAKKKEEEKLLKVKMVEDVDDESDDLDEDDLLEDDDVSDDDDDDVEEDDDDDDDDDEDDDNDLDDDDEEDGDDDEEDDDEEVAPTLMNKSKTKGNKKANDKAEKQTPVAGKKRQNANAGLEQQSKKVKIEAKTESREDQDKRKLYIKGFSEKTTSEALKALSPDILNVRRPKSRNPFAFLEFESEEIAEKNHKILQSAKIDGKPVFVDFAGTKSSNKRAAAKGQQQQQQQMRTKLFVGGLTNDVSEDDLKKAFPDNIHVVLRKGKPNTKNFAFVSFKDEAQAQSFIDKPVIVCGQELKPVFANAPKPRPDKGGKLMNKPLMKASPQQNKNKNAKKNRANDGDDE